MAELENDHNFAKYSLAKDFFQYYTVIKKWWKFPQNNIEMVRSGATGQNRF